MLGRRAFLGSAAAMASFGAYGGLPPQRPDQIHHPSQVAVAAGSRSSVRARLVIVIGGVAGEFIYDAAGNLRSADVGQLTKDPIQKITCQQGRSTFNGHGAVISLFATALDAELLYADTGTVTQGALIASTASAAGVDPFGTGFRAGTFVYNAVTGAVAGMVNGNLLVGYGSDFLLSAIQPGHGFMSLVSGETTNAANVQALLQLVSKIEGGLAFPFCVSSAIFSDREVNGTPWRTLGALGYANSWADSGANVAGKYRIVSSPPNSVEIIGDLTVGTVADQTLIVTLPAGYRPADSQLIRLVVPTGTPTSPGGMRLTVGTDGTVKCVSLAGLVSGTSRVYFHDFISLDA